jgi:hypothetical protein
MVSAIRSLFKYHGHTLPPTKITTPRHERKRGYTKNELESLIQYLDNPLEKLYITITAESGLRALTTLQLRWKHIQQDYNNRADSIALRLEESFYHGRKKAGYTFIGTRSRQLTQHCIEQNLIQTQPDTLIFPFTYHSISAIIQRANTKARNDPQLQDIHGLRHYFIETIQLSELRIDPHHQEIIIGRFSDVDAKHYTTAQFEQLRPDYDKAYPYLDYKNSLPTQTQEFSTKQTELQDTINKLNQRITELERNRQETFQLTGSLIQTQYTPERQAELFQSWMLFRQLLQAINKNTAPLPINPPIDQ